MDASLLYNIMYFGVLKNTQIFDMMRFIPSFNENPRSPIICDFKVHAPLATTYLTSEVEVQMDI